MPRVVASLGYARPQHEHEGRQIATSLETALRMFKRDITKAKHAPTLDKVRIAHLQQSIGDVCLEYGEAQLALERGYLPALKTTLSFLTAGDAFRVIRHGKRIWSRGVKTCFGAVNAYLALDEAGTACRVGLKAVETFANPRMVERALADVTRSEHQVYLLAAAEAHTHYAALLHDVATSSQDISPFHLRKALHHAREAAQLETRVQEQTREEGNPYRYETAMALWNPLTDLGQHLEALTALDVLIALAPHEHAEVLKCRALSYQSLHLYAKAEDVARQALSAYRTTQNEEGVAAFLPCLASICEARHDWQAALDVYKEVVAMSQRRKIDASMAILSIETIEHMLALLPRLVQKLPSLLADQEKDGNKEALQQCLDEFYQLEKEMEVRYCMSEHVMPLLESQLTWPEVKEHPYALHRVLTSLSLRLMHQEEMDRAMLVLARCMETAPQPEQAALAGFRYASLHYMRAVLAKEAIAVSDMPEWQSVVTILAPYVADPTTTSVDVMEEDTDDKGAFAGAYWQALQYCTDDQEMLNDYLDQRDERHTQRLRAFLADRQGEMDKIFDKLRQAALTAEVVAESEEELLGAPGEDRHQKRLRRREVPREGSVAEASMLPEEHLEKDGTLSDEEVAEAHPHVTRVISDDEEDNPSPHAVEMEPAGDRHMPMHMSVMSDSPTKGHTSADEEDRTKVMYVEEEEEETVSMLNPFTPTTRAAEALTFLKDTWLQHGVEESRMQAVLPRLKDWEEARGDPVLSLNLKYTPITLRMCHYLFLHLAEWLKTHQSVLLDLDLSCTPFLDENVIGFLGPLLPFLSALRLNGVVLKASGFKELCQLLLHHQVPSLAVLALSDTSLDVDDFLAEGGAFGSLDALLSLSCLKELDMSESLVRTDVNLSQFRTISASLTTLRLGGSHDHLITKKVLNGALVVPFFRGFAHHNFPSLVRLHVEYLYGQHALLWSRALCHLEDALPQLQLRELHMRRAGLCAENLPSLLHLKTMCPRLQLLDISGSLLYEQAGRAIGQLCLFVPRLICNNIGLEDSGIEKLKAAWVEAVAVEDKEDPNAHTASCYHLSVAQNHLTIHGLLQLLDLVDPCRLRTLIASDNDIFTPDDPTPDNLLAQYLRNMMGERVDAFEQIEAIDLSRCNVDDHSRTEANATELFWLMIDQATHQPLHAPLTWRVRRTGTFQTMVSDIFVLFHASE